MDETINDVVLVPEHILFVIHGDCAFVPPMGAAAVNPFATALTTWPMDP
jgi:hypothetical protein